MDGEEEEEEEGEEMPEAAVAATIAKHPSLQARLIGYETDLCLDMEWEQRLLSRS